MSDLLDATGAIDRETPLDILLHAIADPADLIDPSLGTVGAGVGGQDELEGSASAAMGLGERQAALADSSYTSFAMQGDVQRIVDQITDTLVRSTVARNAPLAQAEGGISSIKVWHPLAGQKSYGPERRLITPPPFLRVTGPLLADLSSLTLNSIPETTLLPTMSSQSHSITRTPIIDSEPRPVSLENGKNQHSTRRIRKIQREYEAERLLKQATLSGFKATLPFQRMHQAKRDKEALMSGLHFPGLWCTSETARGDDKVTGFRLGLDVKNEQEDASLSQALEGNEAEGSSGIEGPRSSTGLPFMSVTSSPLAIVSKPSIKTYKARSMASCLDDTCIFSLCVRIHAQTVRTKYIKTDSSSLASPALTSRTGKWNPYRFEILHRPPLPFEIDPPTASGTREAQRGRMLRESDGKMLYGSIVRLVDVQTGAKSEPMKLVRTDKNEANVGVESGDGDPVSDLQKVAFVKVKEADGPASREHGRWEEVVDESTGGRVYLAAPGARAGGGELRDNEAVGSRKKRVLNTRVAKAVPSEESAANFDSSALEKGTEAQISSNDDTERPPMLPPPPSSDVPDILTSAFMDSPFTGQDMQEDPNLDPTLQDVDPFSLITDQPRRTDSQNAPASESVAQTDIHDKAPLDQTDSYSKLALEPESDMLRTTDEVTPELESAEDHVVGKKRVRTKRYALAKAVVAEEEDDEAIKLTWQAAKRKEEEKEVVLTKKSRVKKVLIVEEVFDWMSFVIAGVDQFATSFFPVNEQSDTDKQPIVAGQAIRLLAPPTIHRSADGAFILQAVLSDTDMNPPASPHAGPRPIPNIFVGPIGPLAYRAFRSTSSAGGQNVHAEPHPAYADTLAASTVQDVLGGEIRSRFPARLPHVLIQARLPNVVEVQQAIDSLREKFKDVAVQSGLGDPTQNPKTGDSPTRSHDPLAEQAPDLSHTTQEDQTTNPIATDLAPHLQHPAQDQHPPAPSADAVPASLSAIPAQPVPSMQLMDADFDTHLADLAHDFENDNNWLEVYTAVQGDLDNTEAIRLALQSVTGSGAVELPITRSDGHTQGQDHVGNLGSNAATSVGVGASAGTGTAVHPNEANIDPSLEESAPVNGNTADPLHVESTADTSAHAGIEPMSDTEEKKAPQDVLTLAASAVEPVAQTDEQKAVRQYGYVTMEPSDAAAGRSHGSDKEPQWSILPLMVVQATGDWAFKLDSGIKVVEVDRELALEIGDC